MKFLLTALLALLPLTLTAQKQVRVFQFNIWQEGTSVPKGFDQIVDRIIESKADVVTLSEVRNYKNKDLHNRLLEALKKKGQTFYAQYAGGDVGLVSRFPITKAEPVPSSKSVSIHAFHLQLPEGKKLIVGSAHLQYTQYAVNLPRGYDGNSFKPITPDKDGNPTIITDIKKIHAMDEASTRDEAIEGFLEYAKQFPKTDIILAGDFNEASHLDWTKETANLFDHNGVYIDWKNSITLSKNGFTDAYRELYPNPVTHPGLTWPSENSGNKVVNWAPKADDRERIDFIYYNKQNLTAKAAHIAGSPKYYVKGKLTRTKNAKDQFLMEHSDWPSDHKGLIIDFTLKN